MEDKVIFNLKFKICHPWLDRVRRGLTRDPEMKTYFVYIMASKGNGTLYVGMTDNLVKRVWQHKNNLVEGFTKKYKVHMLVYYEQTEDVNFIIQREKQIKRWKRK